MNFLKTSYKCYRIVNSHKKVLFIENTDEFIDACRENDGESG